jgi:eukaryotic-like serine/threonine-protein kinase
VPEPTTIGRYVLHRRIAAGGMGEVFVAEQTGVGDFRKPLAIKVMLPGLADDPKHVRLFLAEARLAARLQHPNIVQVFDAGLIEGRYFLTMELIDGVSLSEVIKAMHARATHVTADLICLVARQTLEALRYAHTFADESGRPLEVVHRDISPSNILLSRRGEVKLTDFGIAKMRDSENNTEPGEVRGKLAYIAPELFKGASATVRSDLYALGVTLYRLAALASPFASTDHSDVINAFSRNLVPLVERRPDLPRELIAAIERSIRDQPAERFESAGAMLEAFPRGDLEARQQTLREVVALAAQTPPPPPPVTLQTASVEFFTVADPAATVLELPPVADAGARVTHALEPVPEAPAVARITAEGVAHTASGPSTSTGATSLTRLWTALAVLGALTVGLLMVVLWVPSPTEPSPSPPVERVVPPAPAPTEVPPAVPSAVVVESAPAVVEPSVVEPKDVVERPVKKVIRPLQNSAARVVASPPARLSPPAKLTVQAVPWANVEINGKSVGQTPLAGYLVTTATITLRLTNPDFRAVERTLKLAPGEDVKVNETLLQK